MKIFKRIKWSYVVLSAMFLLLGIFLVANPETSLIMICRILGAAMAVFGVMKIVLYFIRDPNLWSLVRLIMSPTKEPTTSTRISTTTPTMIFTFFLMINSPFHKFIC